MMLVRRAPEVPMRAPTTVSRALSSMNPSAAKAPVTGVVGCAYVYKKMCMRDTRTTHEHTTHGTIQGKDRSTDRAHTKT